MTLDQSPSAYVPGQFRCAKCGLVLMQATISAATGDIGARDEPGDRCPNDGSPLWRVTWEQRATDAEERLAKLLADPRVQAIEIALANDDDIAVQRVETLRVGVLERTTIETIYKGKD